MALSTLEATLETKTKGCQVQGQPEHLSYPCVTIFLHAITKDWLKQAQEGVVLA